MKLRWAVYRRHGRPSEAPVLQYTEDDTGDPNKEPNWIDVEIESIYIDPSGNEIR